MFKRLSNHVSPYTHDVVTTLVKKQATDKMNANNAFLIAKKNSCRFTTCSHRWINI
jgi:D-tyrosyl-tRNA(Tyr) deacylase